MPRLLECIFVLRWSGKAVQQEAGNDFRFADGRMGLLEGLLAESLDLHCPAAVVIAPIYWRRHGDHFVVTSPA